MPSQYEHIFFDLDHTLWDFETNSRETLKQLFDDMVSHLVPKGSMDFIHAYEKINHQMWADYSAGKIDKTRLRFERFPQALEAVGLDDRKLGLEMNDIYMERTPYKTALFPKTREVLTELGDKYKLHLITNGFEEVVNVKLTESKLWTYFQEVIISEVVGFLKPHPRIFESALEITGAEKHQSVFVGDNLVSDIGGAKNFGMDQVYFNPKNEKHDAEPTYEVSNLSQLLEIF